MDYLHCYSVQLRPKEFERVRRHSIFADQLNLPAPLSTLLFQHTKQQHTRATNTLISDSLTHTFAGLSHYRTFFSNHMCSEPCSKGHFKQEEGREQLSSVLFATIYMTNTSIAFDIFNTLPNCPSIQGRAFRIGIGFRHRYRHG